MSEEAHILMYQGRDDDLWYWRMVNPEGKIDGLGGGVVDYEEAESQAKAIRELPVKVSNRKLKASHASVALDALPPVEE